MKALLMTRTKVGRWVAAGVSTPDCGCASREVEHLPRLADRIWRGRRVGTEYPTGGLGREVAVDPCLVPVRRPDLQMIDLVTAARLGKGRDVRDAGVAQVLFQQCGLTPGKFAAVDLQRDMPLSAVWGDLEDGCVADHLRVQIRVEGAAEVCELLVVDQVPVDGGQHHPNL